MNFLARVIVICGLIAGLAVPVSAAEEKPSATEQESAVMEDAKLVAKAERSAVKEESKPVAKVADQKDLEEIAAVVPLADEKGPELTDRKTFRGEVSGISSNFLALEISADAIAAREMTFKVSKDVKLIGRDKIMDFKNGDTVSVLCEETTQSVTKKDKAGKDIKEVKVLGRVVKEIMLMRAAPQPEPEVLPPAPSGDDEGPDEAEEGAAGQKADAGEKT